MKEKKMFTSKSKSFRDILSEENSEREEPMGHYAFEVSCRSNRLMLKLIIHTYCMYYNILK